MMSNNKKKLNNILQSKIVLGFLLLLGLSMIAYPFLNKWHYIKKQDKFMEKFKKDLPKTGYDQILENSREYNKALSELKNKNSSYYDYKKKAEELFAAKVPKYFYPNQIIGKIIIPEIDIEIPIRSGVTDDILDLGAGWMMDSSIPIKGKGTHSVITAHRGIPEAKLFKDLDKLNEGDQFYVEFLEGPQAYMVDNIKIIEPNDHEDLKIDDEKEYITLLTCHPYMINTQRLIIRGYRIEKQIGAEDNYYKENKKKDNFTLWDSYRVYIIGAGVFLVILNIASFIKRRENKKGEELDDRI